MKQNRGHISLGLIIAGIAVLLVGGFAFSGVISNSDNDTDQSARETVDTEQQQAIEADEVIAENARIEDEMQIEPVVTEDITESTTTTKTEAPASGESQSHTQPQSPPTPVTTSPEPQPEPEPTETVKFNYMSHSKDNETGYITSLNAYILGRNSGTCQFAFSKSAGSGAVVTASVVPAWDNSENGECRAPMSSSLPNGEYEYTVSYVSDDASLTGSIGFTSTFVVGL